MTGAHVLIIDDEVPFVETLTKRLTKRQLSIRAAHSGQDGLDVLASDQAIEVVILDVKMPGMDGVETLREIKRQHPLVEVIMLTGHGTIETAIEGMRMGAFDYLLKPCDIDLLVEKVSLAARRKGEQEEKIIEARMRDITSRQI